MSWYVRRVSVSILVIVIGQVFSWNEVSKCTSSGIESNQDRVLNLDCANDFIYIAWSHYGYKNNTANKSCYFTPNDCTVSVEHVSNECNGLSSCKVSLDAQYLHSCKSYSNYLFIVYKCIESKQSYNMCDDIDTSVSSDVYLTSPNYPFEYLNNLDCNCSLQNRDKMARVQIELLEFDLESLSSSINYLTLSSQFLPPFAVTKNLAIESNSSCSRDHLTINSETRLCGTLKPFSTLSSSVPSDLTTLRLKSDDALTRRGVWIKINTLNGILKCPTNFIRVNNVCVKIFTQMLTWYEANSYCSNLGYSLAVIDSFKTDKQINRALFGSDEYLDPFVLDNDSVGKNYANFWVGMRQLNETNWFDFDNKPIEFYSNEKNWWPWLVTDSSTFSHGSCIGKKKDFFFIQDCYKRMPFACQYKPRIIQELQTNIKLKCGKLIAQTKKDYGVQNLVISSTPSSNLSSNKLNSGVVKSSSSFNNPIVLHSNIEEDNSNLKEQQHQINLLPVHTSSDNSLLASLILAFLFLLILINTFVVLFILR